MSFRDLARDHYKLREDHKETRDFLQQLLQVHNNLAKDVKDFRERGLFKRLKWFLFGV